jgi:hypothetical protein
MVLSTQAAEFSDRTASRHPCCKMTGRREDGVGVDDGAPGVAVTPGHLNPVHIRWDKTCSTLNSGNTTRHWHSITADARWHHPVAGLAAVS